MQPRLHGIDPLRIPTASWFFRATTELQPSVLIPAIDPLRLPRGLDLRLGDGGVDLVERNGRLERVIRSIGPRDARGRPAGFHKGGQLRPSPAKRSGESRVGDARRTTLVDGSAPGLWAGTRQVAGALSRTVLAHGPST